MGLYGDSSLSTRHRTALAIVRCLSRDFAIAWAVAVASPRVRQPQLSGAESSQMKNREDRLIVLNDVAKSVVEARRAMAAAEFEKSKKWPTWSCSPTEAATT